MSNVAKLHQAIDDNDVTSVRRLVENGTDVNALYQQQIAFTQAVRKGHYEAADIIMASKLFKPNAANQFDRTPLLMAAKTGQPEYVRKLLAMGAEVDKADVRGVTPLSATASYDNHECASILIDHGANVDSRDYSGSTPLIKACSMVSINVVRVLIKNNCNVDLPAGDSTPLTSALPSVYNYEVSAKKISDMLEVCQMLVDAGCDINKQDRSGRTPLHHAVASNDIYSICFLAENGCNLNVRDNFRFTPFQKAILPGSPRYEAARFLLYFGANSMDNVLSPCVETRFYSRPVCMVLFTHPHDELDHDTKWSRILLLDCFKRNIYPGTILPSLAANLEKQVNEKNQNLHDAEVNILQWFRSFKPYSLQNQILLQIRKWVQGPNLISKINSLPIPGALKKYLNLGLPENSVPLSNICKLYMHIQDGDNQKVWDLIQKDAHNGVHIHQEHSIAVALRTGNTEAAKMLLENTVESHFKRLNPAGDSILHLVARYGRHQLLEAAMDKFKDTNCTNEKGATPLQEAVKAGFLDVAAMIIERDSKVKIETCDDLPMLHIAAASGHPDLVGMLLKKGQNPNMEDPHGNTPLHVTASKGCEYLMRAVSLPSLYESHLASELDAISISMTNRAPRHSTPTSAFIKVINHLLRAGADPKRKNKVSRTALQVAIDTCDLVLIQYLQEKYK